MGDPLDRIISLRQNIRDASARVRAEESTLNTLEHMVRSRSDDAQIAVTVTYGGNRLRPIDVPIKTLIDSVKADLAEHRALLDSYGAEYSRLREKLIVMLEADDED